MGGDVSNNLLIEIIETLEAVGLQWDQYQLHDFVDVEALERVLDSSSGETIVWFTVDGIQLAVSSEGVAVHIAEHHDQE